ncbi:chromosome segregation protein SMC [Marinobacter sp. X15-166B]|uniref:chromosome segregation protein SMC n=1 Tax=Marinobacter sp. X15-166B TaxID=1897620 RepID=UPI000AAD3E26
MLRWQALDQELHGRRSTIRQTELELEKLLTERVGLETSLESLRQSHYERTEHFNRAQARYYEAGSDIARLEQSLQHQRERSRQSAAELDQALASQRETGRELEQDARKLADIEQEIGVLEPEQQALCDHAETSALALQEAETAMGDWQQGWEMFNTRSADSRRQAELAQSRIRALEDAIDQLLTREARLQEEQHLLADQSAGDELEALVEQESICELQCEEAGERIEAATERLQEAREQRRVLEQTLSECRQAAQTLQATLSSQQALLDEQIGAQDDGLQQWLARHELGQQPRIGQQLEIDPDWAFAVEQVLGRFTQGVSVASLAAVSEAVAEAPKGVIVVQNPEAESGSGAPAGPGSLLSKIRNAGGVTDYLTGIATAEHLADALAHRHALGVGQSVITREGVWLSRDWIRMPESDAGHIGINERQRRIDALTRDYEVAAARLEATEQAFEQLQEQLATAEADRDQAQQTANAFDRELGEVRSRLSGVQARAEQIRVRVQRIHEDLEDVRGQRDEHQHQLQDEREAWQEALLATEGDEDERTRLQAQRDTLQASLDQLRQQSRHDQDRAHQLQLQLQRLHSQREGLRQTIDRVSIQQERLQERIEVLREARESAEEPIEDLSMQLEGLLETRLLEEDKLAAAREALENIDQQVRDREQGRSGIEHRVQTVRANLETQKLESQALEIRAGNQLEQLGELDVQLKDVLAQMPAEASESVWAEELNTIANRIQRLGAINLAAIEEFEVQNERKTYLDEQHAELEEALETLDAAIRKIDRETRQRFKETFDQVNGGLQALFPKVFGGGNAYLELTGDDLLETGVAIMARPPGKKNSTIHLLSGGEKALTAIALVFSIFQLNPAPFCMLDEVDAPLDDANVARYAKMVKEMSGQVQFIYISHNKIAMEMADQLIGVTMHEPGCSRLVSVDVETAAALAEV